LHGRGLIITPHKNLQIGTFIEGKINGELLFIDNDPGVYVKGTYKNGKEDGLFTITYNDGEKEIQTWVDGVEQGDE